MLYEKRNKVKERKIKTGAILLELFHTHLHGNILKNIIILAYIKVKLHKFVKRSLWNM